MNAHTRILTMSNKEKYQIPRKSDFICLTILSHDLSCFDKELETPANDMDGLLHKLRNTRNVFVSLHNLKDSMNRIKIDGDDTFIQKTRILRRELEFITHIRNKGVGHLDGNLLERSAQWMPQIFYKKSTINDKFIIFECYRAVMEAAINSYLNEDGEQKFFKTEIDFLYPPNAEQFFNFLAAIVKNSLIWINDSLAFIRSEITFHSSDKFRELGAIAGKTNFNLNEESDFTFCEEEVKPILDAAIAKMQEIGANPEIIDFIRKKLY